MSDFTIRRSRGARRVGCCAASASPRPPEPTIGVVGATASGKSALMDLVPRLFDPQEGEILIDGVPIRDLDHAALRREIGYVTQESFLFSDTIGSNLNYGTDDERDGRVGRVDRAAGRNDQTVPWRVLYAARRTRNQLRAGRSSALRSRGRLARRPSIVLLDDALSAVDTHTEAEILRSLRDTLSGRTALIASHRVSAIRDATLDHRVGRRTNRRTGNARGLLAAGGRYWALLNRQQLEESIESDGRVGRDRTRGYNQRMTRLDSCGGRAREVAGRLQVDAHAVLEARLKEAIVEIAELRARDALKTQFLANISHDLRTPLTAVITHAEILRDGILGDLSPQQMESVRGIISGGRQLLNQVGEILTYARGAANQLTLVPTRFADSRRARAGQRAERIAAQEETHLAVGRE